MEVLLGIFCYRRDDEWYYKEIGLEFQRKAHDKLTKWGHENQNFIFKNRSDQQTSSLLEQIDSLSHYWEMVRDRKKLVQVSRVGPQSSRLR